MPNTDFENAVSEIRKAAVSGTDLDGLRALRALLVDAAFTQQLDDLIERSHNRPNERTAMAAVLEEIKFALRDQLAVRVEQHTQIGLVALGGGVALSVGAVLAVATQILIIRRSWSYL